MRTPEQRRKAVEATRAWRERNPDKYAAAKKRSAPAAKFRQRRLAEQAKHDPVLRARLTAYERRYRLKRQFDLTPEQYDAMVLAQQGCCAICQKKVDQLVVDHNHETNDVRQLLCHNCNCGIGQFKDSPLIAEAAAAYLRKHASTQKAIVADGE